MWTYVITDFPNHHKAGRSKHRHFCCAIEKLGFEKLHKNLYVRYTASISVFRKYRQAIIDLIPTDCQVSIIASSDMQNVEAYHHFGRKYNRKKVGVELKIPESVQFF